MFPKKGNFFPVGGTRRYPTAVAVALRAELGESHQAVKTLMRWTGANERTVKNWLSGKNGPRGEHLIGLLHHSDKMLQTILQLAGRDQVAGSESLFEVRKLLAEVLKRFDAGLDQSLAASQQR
jgi:hypothetical protein